MTLRRIVTIFVIAIGTVIGGAFASDNADAAPSGGSSPAATGSDSAGGATSGARTRSRRRYRRVSRTGIDLSTMVAVGALLTMGGAALRRRR